MSDRRNKDRDPKTPREAKEKTRPAVKDYRPGAGWKFDSKWDD